MNPSISVNHVLWRQAMHSTKSKLIRSLLKKNPLPPPPCQESLVMSSINKKTVEPPQYYFTLHPGSSGTYLTSAQIHWFPSTCIPLTTTSSWWRPYLPGTLHHHLPFLAIPLPLLFLLPLFLLSSAHTHGISLLWFLECILSFGSPNFYFVSLISR